MSDAPVQTSKPLDLEEIRQRLSEADGRTYWKSLEEYSEAPAFQEFLEREFPSQRPRFSGDGASRRDFIRLMGASLAVTGLGACTKQPQEKIVPFAASPESRVPGKPQYFASAMPLDGDTLSVVVESHSGRPTKVDGNTQHPWTKGGTHRYAQAAILELYDPDRLRGPTRAGSGASWEVFEREFAVEMGQYAANGGEGLAILTQEVLSPTLQEQLDAIATRFPRARIARWQPIHRDHAKLGAEKAYGTDLQSRFDFAKANTVVTFDSDVLASGAGHLRYARDFASRRRIRKDANGSYDKATMNRLYAVESAPSLTGAMADHRWARKPSKVEAMARALARDLGVANVRAGQLDADEMRAVEVMAKELRAQRGASVVTAGPSMSPEVHALVHAVNQVLGNVGETVVLTRPVEETPATGATPTKVRSIAELARAMRPALGETSGKVRTLLIVGGNPVLDAPADQDFTGALAGVGFSVHLAESENETSQRCLWNLPLSHWLEAWSDGRAYDGTITLAQPLIAPLFKSRSAHDVFAMLDGGGARSGHDIVKDAARRRWEANDGADTGASFSTYWREALHQGFLPETAFGALDGVALAAEMDTGAAPSSADGTLELAIREDASAFDGRFANNGWLQELPRPLSLLTWDNAFFVGPATAEKLGVSSEDVVEVTIETTGDDIGGDSVRGPVWVQPAHAEGTVTVHLGYGRTVSGRVGTDIGFDAYPLRSTTNQWSDRVTVRKTDETYSLASVQAHADMEGRDILREVSFSEDASTPLVERLTVPQHGPHDPDEVSLYADRLGQEENVQEGGAHYQWGMTIDLNTCTGCNSCVVSCQAENNIPIVGKEEVSKGRELHWIRIDRYYVGDLSDPKVRFQPVACLHCEKAPCEVVCPVGATTHSPEGINEMTYNRCVGTRYCSNNCPYKVRRFNFFRYADFSTETLKLGRNPDVSVRSRGVMEKCTYCIQRVNQARITSKVERRRIRDGEIKTACQTVCPTESIVFGDVSDPNSEVSVVKTEAQNYALLSEMGTTPRTTYLSKITNANPELS